MNKCRNKLIFKTTGAVVLVFITAAAALYVLLVKPSNAYADNDFSRTDPKAQKLANTYINIWKNPELRTRHLTLLHRQNPEWDFMFRTYSVLSFANLALHDTTKQEAYLSLIDTIIDDTLRVEQTEGFKYFLLGYGQRNNWIDRPPQSLFIDGEIALMLAVRCLVENNTGYASMLKDRVDIMIRRLQKSPVLCAESYPDECWIFCNTITLAAVKLSDSLNRTDHTEFIAEWISAAKQNLIDPKTGLLRSAFSYEGKPIDSAKGPEGSSIWMACHMLQFVDESFAKKQYQIACKELMRTVLGFGYSREWPARFQGNTDIDSGPIVPIFGASPSASGLALIAASAFKDKDNFNSLTRSLNTFALPLETEDNLYYQLSNPLGDVVILYGLTAGPILQKASVH